MGGVLIGVIIGVLLAVPQLVRSYRLRDQPEPPNCRSKLPVMLFLLAACVGLAISGTAVVAVSIGGVLAGLEVGFILAGRNPWWMQSPRDRHEYVWSSRTRG
jgi:NhaP-type Na+/H+ or K+/H+ antiporter